MSEPITTDIAIKFLQEQIAGIADMLARGVLTDQDLGMPFVRAVEVYEFLIALVTPQEFKDDIVGTIDAQRFRDADPEIAFHVRRLVAVGLVPIAVGDRILKAAKARTC